jgi:hypothetical protein
MTRDACTVPMDPSKPAYRFSIDPGNGVPITVWTGMAMCGMSFIFCLLASISDYWGESKVESDRRVLM